MFKALFLQMFKALPVLVLAAIILSSLLAPLLTVYDPLEISLDSIKLSPTLKHPFGTDSKGRDVLSRVLYGGRISLAVSFLAVAVSLSFGFIVGLISGYYGGWIDTVLMTLVDFVLSFPSLLLAIGISVILPPGIYTVIFAISIVGWVSFARLIRGQVLKIKELPFVEAAMAIGCSNFRIITRHVLPQCMPTAIVLMGLKFGGYIITEASLSFLGLGTQPPTPSWGSMISENRAYILSEAWMVIFPGLAIALTALCFNIVGDALQQRFDLNINAHK
ncbi:peptide ABC transporter permease [Candidatus Magnetoovum chiemensis]|nr:peptide ABC transporter permease [Candidatus Magnetoovum chiemensis]